MGPNVAILLIPMVTKDLPYLPGSRLTNLYCDASSALLQLVNQWLNFTYSRTNAFCYRRQNKNPALTRIELTTSALAVPTRPLGRKPKILQREGDWFEAALVKGHMPWMSILAVHVFAPLDFSGSGVINSSAAHSLVHRGLRVREGLARVGREAEFANRTEISMRR